MGFRGGAGAGSDGFCVAKGGNLTQCTDTLKLTQLFNTLGNDQNSAGLCYAPHSAIQTAEACATHQVEKQSYFTLFL